MTTMTPARSSPFAAMARDPLHPDVIYRDERCFVVRDINPKAPVHLLIIPQHAHQRAGLHQPRHGGHHGAPVRRGRRDGPP